MTSACARMVLRLIQAESVMKCVEMGFEQVWNAMMAIWLMAMGAVQLVRFRMGLSARLTLHILTVKVKCT